MSSCGLGLKDHVGIPPNDFGGGRAVRTKKTAKITEVRRPPPGVARGPAWLESGRVGGSWEQSVNKSHGGSRLSNRPRKAAASVSQRRHGQISVFL